MAIEMCLFCVHYPAHKAPANCSIYNASGRCNLYHCDVSSLSSCDCFHSPNEKRIEDAVNVEDINQLVALAEYYQNL